MNKLPICVECNLPIVNCPKAVLTIMKRHPKCKKLMKMKRYKENKARLITEVKLHSNYVNLAREIKPNYFL